MEANYFREKAFFENQELLYCKEQAKQCELDGNVDEAIHFLDLGLEHLERCHYFCTLAEIFIDPQPPVITDVDRFRN